MLKKNIKQFLPFKEISVPVFKTTVYWNLHQLWDYMKTWSSVKKYYSENKRDPLDLVKPEVKDLWETSLIKEKLPGIYTCVPVL